MRQCDWCGLITDDDKVCSWCKHTNEGIAATPAPVEVEPRRVWNPRFGWMAGALAVVIGVVLLFPKDAPAAESDDASPSAVTSHEMAGGLPSFGVTAEELPQPKRQYGSRAMGASSPSDQTDSDSIVEDEDLEDWIDQEPVASVALAGAQLGSEVDEEGNEVVAGVVSIVNDGDFAVTSLRLTVDIDGASYPLAYSGFSGQLRPGEEVAVPVMMSGSRPASGGFQVRTVTLHATMEGGGIYTDSAYALPL